jgi:bifunctional enzyme CysN/CysC
MAESPLVPGKQYYLKQATRTVFGSISEIHFRIDVNTLERRPADRLKLNGIALCELALNAPLAFDPYTRCRGTGSFIVIDRLTNVTVGAGMIVGLAEKSTKTHRVTSEERSARFGQKAITLWLSGANARKLAHQLDRMLFDMGHAAFVLEDDSLAGTAAVIAQNLNLAGLICVCSIKNPLPAGAPTGLHIDVEGMQAEDLLRMLQEKGML